MNIVIDGHMIGQNEGGNERYTKNLIKALNNLTTIHVVTIKNNLLRLLLIPFIALKHQSQIVHSNYVLPFWKPFRIKYVVTIHDLSFRRFPNYFSFREKLIFFVFVPYSLWLSDAIIVPSKFTYREFIKFFPYYKNKVKIIYEGVDDVFHKLSNTVKNRNLFLCVVSQSKRKILKQVVAFFKKNKNLKLKIVGSFKHSKTINSNNVKILGYVDDNQLNKLYNQSNALIYLSEYEGFGLPIIEALACGTNVIASDIPTHREIGQKNILYIRELNTKALLNKINKLNTIPNTVSKMIKAKYNWSVTAIKTMSVYNNCICQ